MGSWYGTCGISNLPLVREEVVMIPLKLQSHELSGEDHCYAHDIWCPNGVPVYGKYDDYGAMSIQPNQQRMHELNVRRIANDLVERPHLGEYEPEITAESIKDIDVYQTAIHANRLTVSQRNYAGKDISMIEAPVGRMMVLRTVWDELLEKGPTPRWSGDKAPIFDKAYYRAGVFGVLNEDSLSQAYEDALDRIYTNAHGIRGSLFSFKNATKLTGKMRAAYMGQVADQMAELYVIDNMMGLLRKTWMPQAGAGSQNSALHVYNVLIGAMQKAMAETIEYENAWERDSYAQGDAEE